MAGKRTKQTIEIERTALENFLMSLKDSIKQNSAVIRKAIIVVIVLFVIGLTAFVYINNTSEKAFKKYEIVIDNYRMNPGDRAVIDKTINDLREIARSTKFGYANKMSYYMLGNLLFEDGKYGEAFDMFNVFMKKSSSKDLFIPIAVNKASVCLEEQGKIDEAIALLLKFESDNSDSIVQDQVLYNLGRLYSVKGDRLKAREYYNKVLSGFPESAFADRARERLFIMGTVK